MGNAGTAKAGAGEPVQLAAVILAKNEARHIGDCIATLGFADRVVVSDSYSTDGTIEIAERGGAVVMERPFDNFASQRNSALDSVQAEWIFFVDADERIPPELAAEELATRLEAIDQVTQLFAKGS